MSTKFLVVAIVAALPSLSAAQGQVKPDENQQRERTQIEEQKLAQLVQDLVGKSTRDSDALLESLRAMLNQVKDHPDLSAEVRDLLVNRLQTTIRNVADQRRTAALKAQEPPAPPRFKFKIAANLSIEKLLPPPPRYPQGALLSDDLAQVPELAFQAPVGRSVKPKDALKLTAHQVAKVHHVNAKKRDGYMEALLTRRTDLAGLSFVMGDDCRTVGNRSRSFQSAVEIIRAHGLPETAGKRLEAAASTEAGFDMGAVAAQPDGKEVEPTTWDLYLSACAKEDKGIAKLDEQTRDEIIATRIAALMQVLGPESAPTRQHLAAYLGTLPHVDATRALARLAIFSAEQEVRQTALNALKVRREKDYTDILLQGLRYPWPAVARRSAEALIALNRDDLLMRLVDMLDEPDPRLPVLHANKKVAEVRELVRVNHHRNCLLCHAPAPILDPDSAAQPVLFTAAIPIPGEPLPTGGGYSDALSPDVLVRIDVTYLRQDFSMMLPVADAHPWPEMQRFDYLVRTRAVSEEEATAYRAKLTPREPGVVTPYQRAALHALRELTGRDTAPTATAWRQVLKMPMPAK